MRDESISFYKRNEVSFVIGMLYLAGTNIAMTFINVYLVRVTNNMGIIIIQYMINYISLLLAFVCSTKLVSKISLNSILKTSFALLLCAYMPLQDAYAILMIVDGSLWLIDYYIINKKVNWLEK